LSYQGILDVFRTWQSPNENKISYATEIERQLRFECFNHGKMELHSG